MKKEKSKILFDILIAAASLALVACMVFQTIATKYRETLNYSLTQIFMRLVSANAEMELTNATVIKEMIRMSVMSRPDVRADTNQAQQAEAYFRTVCGNTNVLPGCTQRSQAFLEGMLRFTKDIDALSTKERVFGLLADGALILAMWLTIMGIGVGLRIHELYKT